MKKIYLTKQEMVALLNIDFNNDFLEFLCKEKSVFCKNDYDLYFFEKLWTRKINKLKKMNNEKEFDSLMSIVELEKYFKSEINQMQYE